MSRRPATFSFLALVSAGTVMGQTVPPATEPQPGRVFCEQRVTYQVADPSSVSEPYRRFLGPWSDAAWDANTCAALVVTEVQPDGTASIIYVYGPLGPGGRVPGGMLHGTGIIRDDELRFQNSDGTQFAFRPAIADLIGQMTKPNGQTYRSEFKKTF